LTRINGETYADPMFGPFPAGHLVKRGSEPRGFGHLQPGMRCRVVRDFVDFDGDLHPVGETWTLLGSSFLPYEDGLGLFVSLDGSGEWNLPLQWRPDAQGAILDAFAEYVAPA
jgi:hypothetical protein